MKGLLFILSGGFFSMTITLPAYAGFEGELKKAVRSVLKDPDSAKFGKLTRIDDEHACFMVNAKNAMGGYSGEQPAMLVKMDGIWLAAFQNSVNQELCVRILTDLAAKKKNGE